MIDFLVFAALFIGSGAVAITMFVNDERAVTREKSYRSTSWNSAKGERALYICVGAGALLALCAAIFLLMTDPMVK